MRLVLLLGLLAGSVQAAAPIALSADGRGFAVEGQEAPFHPWGLNYSHGGLIEDDWEQNWERVATDLRKMKALEANVARVHLQFGKMMQAPDRPNPKALQQLARLLKAADEAGLYLDLTGLASYRPSEVPAWYDALEEPARWQAQAACWKAIAETCASSPAVFCYDLINEPMVPGEKREPGAWRSGHLFGGYDFVQFVTLDRGARAREAVAVEWTRFMKAAIRQVDQRHLITLGMLPWSRRWGHLSGFVPEQIAPELDFVSVHLYPDAKLPGEALEALGHAAVGKPVVIEETFPLSCTTPELEEFLRQSRAKATGWMLHFDGATPEELDAREQAGALSAPEAIYRDALRLFRRLAPEFTR